MSLIATALDLTLIPKDAIAPLLSAGAWTADLIAEERGRLEAE